MLTKESIIRVLREKYLYLAAEYGVKRIGLFGSYARDVPTESSNIDLVVEFEHLVKPALVPQTTSRSGELTPNHLPGFLCCWCILCRLSPCALT